MPSKPLMPSIRRCAAAWSVHAGRLLALSAGRAASSWRGAAVSARIALLMAGVLAVQALVNPSLQPIDLVARHRYVVSASVSALDDTKREATFTLNRLIDRFIHIPSMAADALIHHVMGIHEP